jgi:hypothetical protein
MELMSDPRHLGTMGNMRSATWRAMLAAVAAVGVIVALFGIASSLTGDTDPGPVPPAEVRIGESAPAMPPGGPPPAPTSTVPSPPPAPPAPLPPAPAPTQAPAPAPAQPVPEPTRTRPGPITRSVAPPPRVEVVPPPVRGDNDNNNDDDSGGGDDD